jgi:acetyltransferase
MGAHQIAEGNAILNRANIPTYDFPDTAARAFALMWRYGHALDALYETPALPPHSGHPAERRGLAAKLIEGIRRVKRTLLTEIESKDLLAAYGIPVVETRPARTEDEAVAIAAQLGGATVLKVCSHTITHKSDVGGVKLNLRGAAAVRQAFREIAEASAERNGPGEFLGVSVQPMIAPGGYELILGSSTDPQFGPVLLFGAGGQLAPSAQRYAGAPDDGADAHFCGAERRARARPCGPCGTRRIAGALQPPRGRAALDQRDRH